MCFCSDPRKVDNISRLLYTETGGQNLSSPFQPQPHGKYNMMGGAKFGLKIYIYWPGQTEVSGPELSSASDSGLCLA